MNLDKEPYIVSYTQTLYEASNQNVRATRSGNVVTLTMFNATPSTLKSLTIPAEFSPSITIDNAVGWIWQWNTDTSKPVYMRINSSAITLVTYYSNSQGKIVDADDTVGAVFGSVTYCV